MNLNHMFLCLLGVVFLCAVAYAQIPIGGFACKDGMCTTDEKTVDNIQFVINKLAEMVERLSEENKTLKGQCT